MRPNSAVRALIEDGQKDTQDLRGAGGGGGDGGREEEVGGEDEAEVLDPVDEHCGAGGEGGDPGIVGNDVQPEWRRKVGEGRGGGRGGGRVSSARSWHCGFGGRRALGSGKDTIDRSQDDFAILVKPSDRF